jgi:hypothetical protein
MHEHNLTKFIMVDGVSNFAQYSGWLVSATTVLDNSESVRDGIIVVKSIGTLAQMSISTIS